MHTLVYTIPVTEDNIANYAVNSVRSNHAENLTKAPCRTKVIANKEGRAELSI